MSRGTIWMIMALAAALSACTDDGEGGVPTATSPPTHTATIPPPPFTHTATAVPPTRTATPIPATPISTEVPPTLTSTATATASSTPTFTGTPQGNQLQVVAVEPAARSVSAPVDARISVRFDRPLERSSIVLQRSLRVFGRWSGAVLGTLDFGDSDRTVVLTPKRPFAAGESVTLTLSHDVRGADGAPLRPGGYAVQFWTRAQPAAATFAEGDRFSTRPSPEVPARPYGGVASDLNEDGLLDLAIVNEDTADLSVHLNLGGGHFEPKGTRYLLGRRASPSEPADFDGDGHVDIAVANISDGTVSVLLGRGDGSFGPAQVIPVGDTPRGLTVLDVDGDGDTDVAVTAAGSDDVAILLNDGEGHFAVGARVDTGWHQEWALATADVDEDGLLDLVVGAQGDSRVVPLKSMGDGSFQPLAGYAVGGSVWMLVTGDLNGDGHDDIASVQGRSDNAALLFGDGRGAFGPATILPIEPFGLASDLGDLDGDGDLDWITSSYSGEWRFFENRGGTFTVRTTFAAHRAASCALLFDADGDGTLDLGLIDELADEVSVLLNTGRL